MTDVPSQSAQDAVPDACSQGGIEEKAQYIHLGQSGRNTDELAHCRYQTTYEGTHGSMSVKVFLGLFHLVAVEQTHMS